MIRDTDILLAASFPCGCEIQVTRAEFEDLCMRFDELKSLDEIHHALHTEHICQRTLQ